MYVYVLMTLFFCTLKKIFNVFTNERLTLNGSLVHHSFSSRWRPMVPGSIRGRTLCDKYTPQQIGRNRIASQDSYHHRSSDEI